MAINSATALAQVILDSQLLEPAQTREFTRSIQSRFQESKALARELVQRGWLTAYQINLLFQGKANDLLLGAYVIEEHLGEGGMGQVFRARHRMLNRRVALKVIRKEKLKDPEFIRRFYREIQAAAQLAHPNIVVAYDADHAGETHFFAMEFVDGIDLNRLVQSKGPLPIALACDFIRQAALGLQHAFERGMVHRDIKPSNLLVCRPPTRKTNGGFDSSTILGGAGDKYIVKILDMGLVRIETSLPVDDSQAGPLTKVQDVLGTPDFVAPEQARDAHKADIRADLYSLGCTFYYLLSGQAPFPGDTAMEKLLKHSMEEPRPIEELRPETPPAVAAIIRRLMTKAPEDRFQTPAELAVALANLERPSPREINSDVPSEEFIALGAPLNRSLEADTAISPMTRADTSTSARPARVRRTDDEKRRWLMINVGGAGLLAMLVLIFIVVAVLVWPSSTHGPIPTGHQKPEEMAEAELRSLRAQAEDPNADADVVRRQILAFGAAHPGTAPAAEALGLLRKIRSPLDRFVNGDIPAVERSAWQPRELVAILGGQQLRQTGAVRGVGIGGDGTVILSAGDDRILYGRDTSTGLTKFALNGHAQQISAMAVSRDGKTVATAGVDGMVFQWDAKDGREIGKFQAHAQAIWCLEFSHDGKTLATGSEDKTAKLWDVSQKKELFPLPGHAGPVRMVAFAAGDAKLATAASGDIVRLWDVAKGVALPALPETVGKAMSLAFAPEGPNLAIGGMGAAPNVAAGVRLWDVDAAKEVGMLAVPAEGPLAFASKGSLLAVAAGDTVQLWDIAEKKIRATLPAAPRAKVSCLSTDRDGRMLAVGDDQGGVRLFDPATLRQQIGAAERWTSGTYLALSPTDKTLIASTGDQIGRNWDAVTNKDQPLLPSPPPFVVNAAAFSSNGQFVLLACEDSQVRVWDISNNKDTGTTVLRKHTSGVISVAVSPDGATAASASRDGMVVLWDLAKARERTNMALAHGTKPAPIPATSLAFSPDGKTLASAGKDKTVKLWSVESGGRPRLLNGPSLGITAVAWSPDGKSIATAGEDASIQIWDVETQKAAVPIKTNSAPASSLAYRPETGELLTAGQDGRFIFWNPTTGKSEGEWRLPGAIQGMSLSVDGRHVAVSCNGSVYIFRLSAMAK